MGEVVVWEEWAGGGSGHWEQWVLRTSRPLSGARGLLRFAHTKKGQWSPCTDSWLWHTQPYQHI